VSFKHLLAPKLNLNYLVTSYSKKRLVARVVCVVYKASIGFKRRQNAQFNLSTLAFQCSILTW